MPGDPNRRLNFCWKWAWLKSIITFPCGGTLEKETHGGIWFVSPMVPTGGLCEPFWSQQCYKISLIINNHDKFKLPFEILVIKVTSTFLWPFKAQLTFSTYYKLNTFSSRPRKPTCIHVHIDIDAHTRTETKINENLFRVIWKIWLL